MDGPLDDLFDEANQQEELDKWIEKKESTYEDRVVKKVMTEVGLGSAIPALKRYVDELTGERGSLLNFQAFHDTYPSFPTRLCTKDYVKAHEITVPDLFKRLTNTRPYRAFMEMKETIADGEQYGSWGLIFPWNGLGQAILHNNRNLDVMGTRIVRPMGDRQIVYLDILFEFLDALRGWRP